MSRYSHKQIMVKAAELPIIEFLEDRGFSSGSGFCLECKAQSHGVEPDACEYECHSCGAFAVFGVEELLIYIA